MILSATRIRNWMACPMQLKLAKEHPQVEEQVWAKTAFGTLIHACLEWYNNGATIEQAKELFLSVWNDPNSSDLDLPPLDDWKYGKGTTYGGLRTRGLEILDQYHEKNQWESRKVLATEHEFIVPIGDHHLRGFVDLVETKISGGGKSVLRIVDYKTTSKQPTQNQLKFDVQFTTYVYASLQPEFWLGNEEFGTPAIPNGKELFEVYSHMPRRAIWYHLWGNKEIDAGTRDDADFMRLYRCIGAIVDAIEKDVYVPDISADTCTFCDYAEYCPVMIPVADRLNNHTQDENDEEFF